MITIVITKTEEFKKTETVNFTTKKEPTSIAKGNYGEVAYKEEFEVRDIEKTVSVDTQLLKQQMDDEGFDLKGVIRAINGLG